MDVHLDLLLFVYLSVCNFISNLTIDGPWTHSTAYLSSTEMKCSQTCFS